MLNICDAINQFQYKGNLPIFGGTFGEEIKRSLEQISQWFDVEIEKIQKLDQDILDARITKWHEDYRQFTENINELKVKFTNTIDLAFMNVKTVREGVELIDKFKSIAFLPEIKKHIDKKVLQKVENIFKDDLEQVTSVFDNLRDQKATGEHDVTKCPKIPPMIPRHAGLAMIAQSLVFRLESQVKELEMLKMLDNSSKKTDDMEN